MKSKWAQVVCSYLLLGIFLSAGILAHPTVNDRTYIPHGIGASLSDLDDTNDLKLAHVVFSSPEFQQFRGANAQEYEKISQYFLGTLVSTLSWNSIVSTLIFSWTYGTEIIFGSTDIIYPFHYFW